MSNKTYEMLNIYGLQLDVVLSSRAKAIVLYTYEQKGLTKDQICRAFDISAPTFYRDVEDIQNLSSGRPILITIQDPQEQRRKLYLVQKDVAEDCGFEFGTTTRANDLYIGDPDKLGRDSFSGEANITQLNQYSEEVTAEKIQRYIDNKPPPGFEHSPVGILFNRGIKGAEQLLMLDEAAEAFIQRGENLGRAYQMVGAALLHAYLVDKRSIVEEAKGTLPWPDSRREMLTFMFYIERILEIALDNVRQVRELPLWEGVPKLSTAEMQEIINGTDGLTTTPEDLSSWGQLIQKMIRNLEGVGREGKATDKKIRKTIEGKSVVDREVLSYKIRKLIGLGLGRQVSVRNLDRHFGFLMGETEFISDETRVATFSNMFADYVRGAMNEGKAYWELASQKYTEIVEKRKSAEKKLQEAINLALQTSKGGGTEEEETEGGDSGASGGVDNRPSNQAGIFSSERGSSNDSDSSIIREGETDIVEQVELKMGDEVEGEKETSVIDLFGQHISTES